MLLPFLLTLSLHTALATAGNAIVGNRCPYDIWVVSTASGSASAPIKIPSRTKHTEPIGTLASLKISKTPSISQGTHTQFEYSVADGKLWYNISFVDCAAGESADACPGHDLGLQMSSPGDVCPKVSCPAGGYCPQAAYYVPQPLITLGIEEPVFRCPDGVEADLFMVVCAGEAPLKRGLAGRVEVVDV